MPAAADLEGVSQLIQRKKKVTTKKTNKNTKIINLNHEKKRILHD